MTDRSKFEQMLEHLINEEQDKAKELFHELVVEKSREIYENILSESFGDEDENFGDDKEFGDDDEDFGDEHDVGGDAADDFIDDMESDEGEEDFGNEDEGLEDRVEDLEDALDDLRREFEELMDQESDEDEHDDMDSEEDFGSDDEGSDFGMDDEGEDQDNEMGDEDFADLKKESFFREYVEKVSVPKGGDDGANTKSVVAKPNKMGGTAQNIVRGDEETTGGTKGGLAKPSATEENFGNINVPGGNAGKTGFKKREPGHGAEKKGTGDKAANTKSVVGASQRKR